MNKLFSILLAIISILIASHSQASHSVINTTTPTAGPVSANDQVVNLSLQDAVYLGLRDNRSIQSSYISRTTQKFDLRVSEDRFTPKVTISVRDIAGHSNSDRYRQSQAIPSTDWLTSIGTRFSLAWSNELYQGNTLGRSGNDGITFSIVQPLLKDAGYDVNMAPIRLARLQEQSNRLALQATVAETINQIITAYRALLSAQEQVRISEEGVQRARDLLATNAALIQSGRMAEFENVQTEADIAAQELNVEEAKNQVDDCRLTLLQLLSLDLTTAIKASDNLSAEPFSISPDQAILKAEEHEPNYLIQLINIKLAEISLMTAKNQRLWDISLVGGTSQNRIISTYDSITRSERQWDTYAGVQVSIPLGDLSARQAEVRAQTDLENQQLQSKAAGATLEKNVVSSMRNIRTRWRQLEIARKSKALTAQKLQIEQQKLNAGRSSNFEVLSYEADLRTAESTLLNATISYLDAQSQLDLSLGTTLESWDISLND